MKTRAHPALATMRLFKALLLGLLILWALPGCAQDMAEIKERGVLRHLGVPYARFVSGNGDGMDVEIAQLFAKHLGVRYEYVASDWFNIIQDLIGQQVEYKPNVRAFGNRPVRGDIIGSGLTILPARAKLVDYSIPTFPSAVWLLARADVKVTPITPSGNLENDIKATKERLSAGTTFVMDNTCIDPKLYGIDDKVYRLLRFSKDLTLNDIVPALLKHESEMTLLDVPDVIVAMEKWPGEIKVIGPVSREQRMGMAFRKSSPELRQEFNEFFTRLQKDGTYMALIRKYYRTAPHYLPDFFRDLEKQAATR